MFLFLLILLLIAAAFGVLGAVLKATIVITLGLIFSLVILGAIGYYFVRHRWRRFQNDQKTDYAKTRYVQQQQETITEPKDPPQLED